MTPKQLSETLGVTSTVIRKFARKEFGKSEGAWNFTPEQILAITKHFKGTDAPAPTPTPEPAPAAAVENAIALPKREDFAWRTGRGLTEIARDWLKETYGMELTIPVELNSRITRALGRFQYLSRTKKPVKIEIGTKTIDYYGKEVTLDVLKHELIHYACFVLGKPYRDGEWYFENELVKHGITRTNVFEAKGLRHVYACSSCGMEANRVRKINPSKLHRYTARCCNAALKYIGRKEL